MTTSDASIFITRDALANQILEFGVRTGTDTAQTANGDWWSPDAAYARDLAEHLMSEFIVIEPEPEEADAKGDASLCAVCGGESFHHTVECAWPQSVEVKIREVDPEVMALMVGNSRMFRVAKPASNGRVKTGDAKDADL